MKYNTQPQKSFYKNNFHKNHHIKTHTILVDDYRCMGQDGYPSKENLLDLLKEINSNYKIKFLEGFIPNDVVCAYL